MAKVTRSPSGHRCGESHHKAKIPDETVREMRKLYEEWVAAGQAGVSGAAKGYGAIAEIYGCSIWTARDIVTYRTRANA